MATGIADSQDLDIKNWAWNGLDGSTGDCPISCHLMDRESVKERLRQGD